MTGAAPPLPPRAIRMGGEHFMSDDDLVDHAVRDVRTLEEVAGLTPDSRVLDWGCGAGRLAIGLLVRYGKVRDYHGVDVLADRVAWAQENLADEGIRFTHVDVANPRYNAAGAPTPYIPVEPGSIDVAYAYSVWSHMTPDDVAAYARIVADALAPGGRAAFTAFVEDGVPSWTENPEGYGPLDWEGALHCVRYERVFLTALLRDCGLEIVHTMQGTETDGQSMLVMEAH